VSALLFFALFTVPCDNQHLHVLWFDRTQGHCHDRRRLDGHASSHLSSPALRRHSAFFALRQKTNLGGTLQVALLSLCPAKMRRSHAPSAQRAFIPPKPTGNAPPAAAPQPPAYRPFPCEINRCIPMMISTAATAATAAESAVAEGTPPSGGIKRKTGGDRPTLLTRPMPQPQVAQQPAAEDTKRTYFTTVWYATERGCLH